MSEATTQQPQQRLSGTELAEQSVKVPRDLEPVFRAFALPSLESRLRAECEGNGVNYDAYMGGVKMYLAKNLELQGEYAIVKKCEPLTIIDSVRQAIGLRLRFDSSLQHAALAPYGGKCQLMIMYRGMVHMLLRDEKVKKVECRVVFQGDDFAYQYGTGKDQFLRHTPKHKSQVPTHFYAIVWLPNGEEQFEVMDTPQVDAIRDAQTARNKGKESPAWRGSYTQMGRKTVLRRLVNYLDITPEMQQVLAQEEERIFAAEDVSVSAPSTQAQTKSKIELMKDHMGKTSDVTPTPQNSGAESEPAAPQPDPTGNAQDAPQTQTEPAVAPQPVEKPPSQTRAKTGGGKHPSGFTEDPDSLFSE